MFWLKRSPKTGSMFITLLCEIVLKESDQEISSILIDVNYEIGLKKKASTFENRLTKRFFLTPNRQSNDFLDTKQTQSLSPLENKVVFRKEHSPSPSSSTSNYDCT
jgi:hypothetical protein